MEATHDYLVRGRQLKDLDTERLKERWTMAWKAWSPAGFPGPDREVKDTTSELALREIDPPYETVRAELAEARLESLRSWNDPEVRAAIRARNRELLKKRNNSH